MNYLEISRNNISISKERGFLIGKTDGECIVKRAFDTFECLIVSGFGIRYSHNLIVELCNRNIPMVICGSNFMPCGFLSGTEVNYDLSGRLNDQISTSKAFNDRLWQEIIRKKIKNQYLTLMACEIEDKVLSKSIKTVQSGDISNVEGQMASRYWKDLFGKEFRRDFDKPGINSFLNFGYAILRSTVVRAIAASGLHQSFGIHHCNRLDPWCLADDMMEPYRPYVDYLIKRMEIDDSCELTPQSKKELLGFMEYTGEMSNKRWVLYNCIQNSIDSLVKSYREKKNLLLFPDFEQC